MPTTSLLITVHNKARYLDDFLDEARRSNPEAELVLVDDGSTDGSTEILKAKADVFVRTENVWEVIANNAGLRAASGDYIAILQDDDFILPRNWINAAVAVMESADIGILGCRGYGLSLYQGDATQAAAVVERALTSKGLQTAMNTVFKPVSKSGEISFGAMESHLAASVINAVPDPDSGVLVVDCGSCGVYRTEVTIRSPLIISRRTLDTIGFLDETYAPLNFDDHDFCQRAIAAGITVAFTRIPGLVRFRGGSRWLYAGGGDEGKVNFMKDAFSRNQTRFYSEWLKTAPKQFAMDHLGTIAFAPSLISFQTMKDESAKVVQAIQTGKI